MEQTFNQWYSRVKFKKTAYFTRELKPLLEKCWKDARPEKKMTRSAKQRKYQWGVVYETMSKDLGYTPKEIHHLMGKEFLSYEHKGKWFIKSTTELTTKKMEVYLESVRRFAAMELSCVIPLPNETNFDYEMYKP